jgi:hypothetical protein
MMAARLYNIERCFAKRRQLPLDLSRDLGTFSLGGSAIRRPVLCQPRGRRSKVCWDSAAVLSTDKSHAKPVRIPFKRVGLGAKRAGLLTVCLNPDRC